MAPPNRITPEQLEWLNSLKAQFSEHQKQKTLSDFWSNLDRDWFARWPEPGVAEGEHEPAGHPLRNKATKALSCRKSYLRNWFNNRSINKRKAPLKTQTHITTFRSHQPVEIYSKQFYKEKVKPLVTTELAENEVPRSEKLGVVRNLTRAAFNAESEDVREAIFAQAKAMKAENAVRRADAKKFEGALCPEGYATAIESVAYVLDSFVRDLSMRTGWAFSVLGGGPDPVNGGRIQTISFHEGRNFLGATFKKAHVSFDESVLKPYVEFLNQVYPPAVCEARALLHTIDDPLDSPLNDRSDPARNPGLVSPSANGAPEISTSSDIPETQERTENESSPFDMAQDMSNIDPQLRPPSSTPSTTLSSSSTNLSTSHPPPTQSFSPQEEPATPALTASPIYPPAATATPSSALTTATAPSHFPSTGSLPVLPTPPATTVHHPTTKKSAPVKKPRKRPGVRPSSILQKVADKAAVVTPEASWSKELTQAVKIAEAKAVKAAEAKAAKAAEAKTAKAAEAEAAAPATVPGEAETGAEPGEAETETAPGGAETATVPREAETEAASVPSPGAPNIPSVLQRSQRARKAATSKEVVPLVDKVPGEAEAEMASVPSPGVPNIPSVLQRSQRVRKAATSKEVVPLVDKQKCQHSKENDAPSKKIRIR